MFFLVSLILEDASDVARYILETNLDSSNVLVNGQAANFIVDQLNEHPVITHDQGNNVIIRTYGLLETNPTKDLFYNYIDVINKISVDVRAINRDVLIDAFNEVRRTLFAVRKLIDFSDGGINDTNIKERYDLIFLTDEMDLTNEEDGIFIKILQVTFEKREQGIIT